METKFTKGKWSIHKKGNLNVISDNNRMVATSGVYQTNSDNGAHVTENEANALLISKAPEFYQDAKDDLELFENLLIELPLNLQHVKNAIKERKEQKQQLLKEATEL